MILFLVQQDCMYKSHFCEKMIKALHLLICFTCVGCPFMLPFLPIFKLLFVNSCFKKTVVRNIFSWSFSDYFYSLYYSKFLSH